VAELQREFPDASFSLKKSAGGVFEVTVEGKLVYSKKAMGRHAASGEILELVRKEFG
jgi:selenoprotein W-related protein